MATEDSGLLTLLLRVAAQEEISEGTNFVELAVVATGRLRLLQYLEGEDLLSANVVSR